MEPRPFSWSVSRHDTFDSCRRKYYYSYYGALEDPEIARLKKLSALPLWTGSVVHETIEAFLKERDALPSEAEQKAIAEAAVHERMKGDWRDSEAASLRFRLFEHEYEQDVSADDKKIAVSTVRRCLRAFFRSQTLKDAFAAGRANWLSLEDLIDFQIEDVPVFLRMDLAYRATNGQVVIVDWKTGRSEGRFNAVQLAGYALYAAAQKWADAPEQIETELAYLAVPRFVRRRVDADMLAAARRFVVKSAGKMRSLLADPERNLARIDDFARIDNPRRCRRCNFRRLCFPRPEALLALSAEATS